MSIVDDVRTKLFGPDTSHEEQAAPASVSTDTASTNRAVLVLSKRLADQSKTIVVKLGWHTDDCKVVLRRNPHLRLDFFVRRRCDQLLAQGYHVPVLVVTHENCKLYRDGNDADFPARLKRQLAFTAERFVSDMTGWFYRRQITVTAYCMQGKTPQQICTVSADDLMRRRSRVRRLRSI